MLECNLQPWDRWSLQGAKRVGKSAADSPVSPFAVTGGEEARQRPIHKRGIERLRSQRESEGHKMDQMKVLDLGTAQVEKES